MTHALRTSAGSHERFLVIEVFGRYAGFTALLPTMAGAANRCVIPEHVFDIEQLCELLTADRHTNPSKYSVVLVSEGATFKGMDEMVFEDQETDAFGHKKLGGIGDLVSHAAQGALAEVQRRAPHRRDQPAPRLPRALRRPRRARLDRADGVRQPGASTWSSTGSPGAWSTSATGATTTCRSTSSPAARRSSTSASTTTPSVCARSTRASRPSRSSS